MIASTSITSTAMNSNSTTSSMSSSRHKSNSFSTNQQHQQHQYQPNQILSQSYKIITQYGDMLVVKQSLQSQHQLQHQSSSTCTSSPVSTSGSHFAHQTDQPQQQQQQQQQQTLSQRPVIMTFHDIGLNSELQFSNFCECDEVKLMLQTFTMLHVNLIGQEFRPTTSSTSGTSSSPGNTNGQIVIGKAPCERLPDDFKYPSVEQLAECIVDVCAQLRVRSFIGLAVGAGAYIAGSLALMRPDLVDGLFLINPVFSSCSITEWLYFKMSAIASNQSVHSWAQNSSSANKNESSGHSHSSSDSHDSPKQSSIRRLLQAAHIHLPANESTPTSEDSPERPRNRQPAGARLRQLIFSRHVRSANFQQQQQQAKNSPVAAPLPSAEPTSSAEGLTGTSSISSPSSSTQVPEDPSQTAANRKETDEQEDQQQRPASTGSNNSETSATASVSRRPPIEYLMYHHFGPTSSRRCSDSNTANTAASLAASGSKTSLSAGSGESPSTESSPDAGGSYTATVASGVTSRRMRRRTERRDSSRSQDSLAAIISTPTANERASQGGGTPAHRRQRTRSGSFCLSASYLASLSSERQRAAHMQAVYKHYFNQLNTHNLWLLAHSFAKRRTLNLRKDCGAAAHAAAAAATLGTSICTAFVGVHGPPGGGGESMAAQTASLQSTTSHTAATMKQQQQVQSSAGSNTSKTTAISSNQTGCNNREQQPQVAGTKVKRTFTCQTLIMCSAVQTHCERAFKLMSLLNPLQATWIKTDHLLVLEERPDKVCQALRLFLQGIGYSMSTYERRLRLSSRTGSQSSADSNGSGRSMSSEKG